MTIGYVTLPGPGATDACLAQTVAQLRAAGLRALAGTVQTNPERPGRSHCDMDLQILPDGPALRITQDLGPHARGCRLDAGVLEQAAALTAARLDGAALLVVNKFGKQEAMGRGLVPVIAEACARGIPVLVGVNGANLQAFLDFVGDMATALPPGPAALADWALAQVAADAA